jgi:hypothetical protein
LSPVLRKLTRIRCCEDANIRNGDASEGSRRSDFHLPIRSSKVEKCRQRELGDDEIRVARRTNECLGVERQRKTGRSWGERWR